MSFPESFTGLRAAYELPIDDLIGEVLIPAMRSSGEVRIAVGFFSSRCLAQIAPGLADFVNDSEGTLKLLVSPELSEEDQYAIKQGTSNREAVVQESMTRLFEEARLSASAIERHAANTLAFLVAAKRLDMRVVFMERGIYHKKQWLFGANGDWLAVHGSSNATERGLIANGEQMSVDRSWLDGQRAEERIRLFLDQWDTNWDNRHETSVTVRVDRALDALRRSAPTSPPAPSSFWEAWEQDGEAGIEPVLPAGRSIMPHSAQLMIPPALAWKEGRFGHQAKAVDALTENNGGILSIATGGGKTITALIAASKWQSVDSKHLCVVVIAPTRPLIRQWMEDIRKFGVEPVVLSGASPTRRLQELERASLSFQNSTSRTEVFLLTPALFASAASEIRGWFEKLPPSVDRLLIADEVHNLGARSFITAPPTFFERRVGLSATPVRQYDPDGTDELFAYFGGEPVFEFTLRDAIDAGCLVPYTYHLHEVAFSEEEMDLYEDLTRQLIQSGLQQDDKGQTMNLTQRQARLLRDRRALVEQADGKLSALSDELSRIGRSNVARTLIYTSAKPVAANKVKQITSVNFVLQELGIIAHQFTSVETQSKKSQSILDRFGAGDYQALTSMRVLDEGVNIPQTDSAFIMASSTVEREWVQRRGRILRTAPNKSVAALHDFIVIPPDLDSTYGRSLLRGELRRVSAYADLSLNEHDPGGPASIIQRLEDSAWERVI